MNISPLNISNAGNLSAAHIGYFPITEFKRVPYYFVTNNRLLDMIIFMVIWFGICWAIYVAYLWIKKEEEDKKKSQSQDRGN